MMNDTAISLVQFPRAASANYLHILIGAMATKYFGCLNDIHYCSSPSSQMKPRVRLSALLIPLDDTSGRPLGSVSQAA